MKDTHLVIFNNIQSFLNKAKKLKTEVYSVLDRIKTYDVMALTNPKTDYVDCLEERILIRENEEHDFNWLIKRKIFSKKLSFYKYYKEILLSEYVHDQLISLYENNDKEILPIQSYSDYYSLGFKNKTYPVWLKRILYLKSGSNKFYVNIDLSLFVSVEKNTIIKESKNEMDRKLLLNNILANNIYTIIKKYDKNNKSVKIDLYSGIKSVNELHFSIKYGLSFDELLFSANLNLPLNKYMEFMDDIREMANKIHATIDSITYR
jgi:hypothetical protein